MIAATEWGWNAWAWLVIPLAIYGLTSLTLFAVGRTDETQYITEEYIAELENEMVEAAQAMEFERAAMLRDQIKQLRDSPELTPSSAGPAKPKPGSPRSRRRSTRRSADRHPGPSPT